MLNIGDTETEICVFTKRSSEKLLARLKQHHDYSVPFVPRACAKVDEEQVVILEKVVAPIWDTIKVEPEIEPSRPGVEHIQRICGKYFGTSRDEIIGSDQRAVIVYPRQIAIYLSKIHSPRSWHDMGKRFRRDHTTTIHGFQKIQRLIQQDWLVAFDVAHVEAML